MILKVGTKEQFRDWLLMKCRMNYTQYANLPTDRKLAIQEAYQGKTKKAEDPCVTSTGSV